MLVAVEDPALHPEALHLAAATGRPIVDTRDPATVANQWSRAHAVIIDAATAAALSAPPRRNGVYFVTADAADIDFEAALQVHASGVFILPARQVSCLRRSARCRPPKTHRGRRKAAARRYSRWSGLPAGQEHRPWLQPWREPQATSTRRYSSMLGVIPAA